MKLKTFIVTLAMTAAMSAACFAQDISVSINGNIVSFPNQQPVIVEGRTLIPLRGVFDNMGYAIDWNGETKTVTLTKGSDNIVVNIGESCYYLNGEQHAIDVPAQIINSSTMLPLRAIGEASGCEVLWDGETKIATIVDTSAVSTEPIQGTVYTTDQSEMDFINQLTAVNGEFNTKAVEFINLFQKINTEGINGAEDLATVRAQAAEMNAASSKASQAISAIPAPAKYQNVKDTSVKYMNSLAELTQLIVDGIDGNITPDEYISKLNTIGTQVALNEAEYQTVMKSMLQ
ncbi:MAG: copper amine oxidase N-terminal domain-containing protein [Firmicutes bacterium]|nr:copper amine oxidase N-terminal domain-containing protein [Bacillota bacterium]